MSRQTPEQKRKILAAEQRYLHSVNDPTGGRIADSISFSESLKGPSKFHAPSILDPVVSV